MATTASILLSLSIALLLGLLLPRLAKKVRRPAVSAYLIAGVLVGPFVLCALGIPGIGITENPIEGVGIISDLAPCFIAFSIIFPSHSVSNMLKIVPSISYMF